LPQGVQKVTSIEGVTEYAFPNGLHVLLFPDNSKPKITVNVVYLVGSRNEGYGETGMAHLLEHMTFKSAKSGRELFKELTDRAGGNFNGKHPTTRRCTLKPSTPATITCAGRWAWKRTAW
jgi:zinc protease